MQESTEQATQHGEKPREERSRLLLLIGVVLVALGGLIASGTKAPLSGDIDRASHVKTRAKEEIDRNFKEGVALLNARQYEKAMSAFHRVLELAPTMPEAHVNAGFALLGMGNARAAADFFNSAIELRSNQLNAYYGLAEALTELGDTFGAMQSMETYVHLAPQNDPFRRKAEAAVWELRAKLDAGRTDGQAATGKDNKSAEAGVGAAKSGGKP